MERIFCKKCGHEKLKAQGQFYICEACGAVWDKMSSDELLKKLRDALGDEREKLLSNAKKKLWNAIHEKNGILSRIDIKQYANEVLTYDQEDFSALFYRAVANKDHDYINDVLDNADAEVCRNYAIDMIEVMTLSMETPNIGSLMHFIERMGGFFPEQSDKFLDLRTRAEDEAARRNSSLYYVQCPRDVFLAYSSADSPKVVELMKLIEKHGRSCFAAFRNLRHGIGSKEDYRSEIETALESCKCVVFVSSENSRTFNCDALGIELPYIQRKKLPMLRVEYVIETYGSRTGGDVRRFLKEFFETEYCKDPGDLMRRIDDYLNTLHARETARKYCQNCGAENTTTAKFCSECGGNTFCDSHEEYVRISTEKRIREEYEKKFRDMQKAEEERLKKEPWLAPDYPTLENYDRDEFEIEGTVLKKFNKKDFEGEVKIPRGVTEIGEMAFSDCKNLISVIIPGSVTSIGVSAFDNCESLTNIVIPKSVTSIGYDPFTRCSSLEKIVVEEGNPKYIVRGNCLIEKESKTLISGCKTSVIPTDGSVTSIGEYAFFGCDSLTSIVIPGGVTSIGEEAFCGCNLTSIVIPKSVTSIGVNPFTRCSSLEKIVVEEENPKYISRGNCLIEKESKTLISGFENSVIPTDGSVISIGKGAFYECHCLTSIVIPEGVISIGEEAFEECENLTSIVIPKSVTSIGEWAFSWCESLTSIVIPKSVTKIGEYAFYRCDKLKIDCEAKSKPAGWDKDWNPGKRPVEWGYRPEEDRR